MPRVTGLAHVELSVSDLDASSAWYSRLLDAPEVFRARDDAQNIVAAALNVPGCGTIIAFTRHDERIAGEFTPRSAGLDHVSFAVADRDELDSWVGRLDKLGIEHGPIDDYGYAFALTCKDPDGIALEFFLPKPRMRADPITALTEGR